MGLHLMGNYGLVNVRIEELDNYGMVTQVLVPSTIMYVPIKVDSAIPSTGRIDAQSMDYYLQFFSDITFLGCGFVPWVFSSAQYWVDVDAVFTNMRKFMPNNQKLINTNTNIIRVVDIGSGYYFRTNGVQHYFFTNRDQLIGSYSSEGCCPFSPGSTNIYSGNFCITSFVRNGDTATVNSLAFVGVRGTSNYADYLYGLYTNVPDSICTWLNNVSEYIPRDPYGDGGNSTPSEMTGDFDGDSDPIDFPALPTLSAVDTGFISIYNPTLQQLKNLATYMWDDSLFSIAGWQKLFADPMDAILALAIVPVAVPNGGTVNVKVGNVDTTVPMTKAQTQYVELDCGTLNVNEYWSAYLDYEPHTKCEIYLPYCGTHQLSVDDIMNKPVHVKYHIDILSGGCVAYVKCGESVLYEFSGQCATMIPISAQEYGNVISSVVSVAVSIGSMVASGGATAPLAVPAVASTALNGGLKPSIEKSGSVSGVSGLLAIQKPYLILTRPNQAHPENQSHYTGYPSFITEKLSGLTGYTEIEKIHLEGVPATDDELSEIESLLKGGVIL